jgi:hypothetical protein
VRGFYFCGIPRYAYAIGYFLTPTALTNLSEVPPVNLAFGFLEWRCSASNSFLAWESEDPTAILRNVSPHNMGGPSAGRVMITFPPSPTSSQFVPQIVKSQLLTLQQIMAELAQLWF